MPKASFATLRFIERFREFPLCLLATADYHLSDTITIIYQEYFLR